MILSSLNTGRCRLPTIEGVYIVGGTARDLLLGKPPADYDIAVFQNPELFAQKTAAKNRGRLIPMGRPGKRSFRVVAGNTILDITAINGPTIRNDLERRDVTINAMAIELSSGTLLDWQNGQRDLGEKTIRMVSEKSFRDDPIRLLRAFRLAATLGFSIEPHTVSAIIQNAPLIRLAAGERIRSELFQLLACADSSPHVALMDRTGLLQAILPDLPPISAIEKTGPDDADDKTRFLRAYHNLENLVHQPRQGFSPPDRKPEPQIPPERAAWLKFTKLLNRQSMATCDKALPEGYQKRIAELTNVACRRLRLSNKERKFVTGIVDNHPRPFHLHDAFARGVLTPEAAIRFFMAVDTLTPPLLLSARADAYDRTSFPAFTDHLLQLYYGTYLPGKSGPPLLSGRDLKNVLGLPSSPLLKKILTRLEEGRLSGELTDKSSALHLAKKLARTLESG